MTQIKLSIAFVLAAAAIASIVAQPIRDAVPILDGNVDHHRHHHKHVEQSPLEQTSERVHLNTLLRPSHHNT